MSLRVGAGMLSLGAALSGCIYNFDNPVVTQSSGTVSGQLVPGTEAAGQSLDGAKIELLWSNLSITLGSHSSYFNFLDLPAGTYRLKITVPPPASNDLPIEYAQGQLYLPQTPSGAADTVALGQVRLNLAGVVGGTIAGLGDGGGVVGAFVPDPADGGVGEYEGYSTTTDATGAFSLTLPAGTHQLWASSATGSGTVLASVQAGQSVGGQQLTLAPPDGGVSADLVTYAVIGDYGSDAPVSELQSIIADGGLGIDLSPAGGVQPPTFSFETPVPAQGVTGLRVDQPLVPGTLYQVTVSPPASVGRGQLVPAALENIPAIAGRATFLQQTFLFSVKTFNANSGAGDGGSAPADGGLAVCSGDGGHILLVDNDTQGPPTNSIASDASLTVFQNWLTNSGITYSNYSEPSDGSDTTDVNTLGQGLSGISTVIWFTGSNPAPLSATQQSALQTWLDQGCHMLILFAPELVSTGVDNWSVNETNAFLTQYIGAVEDLDDPNVWVSGSNDQPIDNVATTTITGAGAFAPNLWSTSTTSGSLAKYHFSIISPLAGVDTLATVQADPTNGNTALSNASVAVATGRKHVGASGSSTVVWVGFTVETILPGTGNFKNPIDFFTAVQTYAGVP